MANRTIINPCLIFLDESVQDKQDVIWKVAKVARQQGYVREEELFVEAVLQREQEVSTAVGYSIAIPHGKTDEVGHPFIAFFRGAEPFTWADEEKVHLIFLIGVPETGSEKIHLKFISQVSKKLLDAPFREKLSLIQDKNEIVALLNAIDI